MQQLQHLITEIADHPVGGLLGVPVRDTLKNVSAQGNVMETIDRENLWQAQTPQLFRYGLLQRALRTAKTVTDEASAIEEIGLKPKMVLGSANNIKITFLEDLILAKLLLAGPHDKSDQILEHSL